MRKLGFEDTFLLSKVIDDLNIETEISKFIKQARDSKETDMDKVGLELFLLIAKRWHRGKTSVMEFIAAITEKDIEEVKRLSLKDVKHVFVELVQQEDIADFFKSASEESR